MNNEYRLIRFTVRALCLLILAAVWLFPIAAIAQEASESTGAGSEVGELLLMVLKIIFSVLGILGTWLVTKAIGFFEKKTKIDIPTTTENLLFSWADQGIGFAYEKSHKELKEHGKKLKGPEKMEIAVGFLNEMIEKYGLHTKGQKKLEDYIEARLGLKRKDEEAATQPAGA